MVYLNTHKTSQASVLRTYLALIITTKVVAIMTNQKVLKFTEEEKEVWKDIEGYEGYYQVSNKGRVRSLDRKIKTRNRWGKHTRLQKGKILKPAPDDYGYLGVGLCVDSNSVTKPIHRLVAEAFVDNPENKPQVNHIDGVKKHNNVDNIEWVTCSENIIHSFKMGMSKPMQGEKCGTSKLKREEVLEIRAAYNLGCFTHKELADAYNVNRRHIGRIVNRKRWKHI